MNSLASLQVSHSFILDVLSGHIQEAIATWDLIPTTGTLVCLEEQHPSSDMDTSVYVYIVVKKIRWIPILDGSQKEHHVCAFTFRLLEVLLETSAE